ncbi:hypothetical protein [Maricaulis sp. MIT060901]|uniref:hypothetical protein n=1 Tax=Maricaulis sp. MIT060901 TaxID=3096993 RepID=UPI003999C04D
MITTVVAVSFVGLSLTVTQDVHSRHEQYGAYRYDGFSVSGELWARTARCAAAAYNQENYALYWYFQNFSTPLAIEYFTQQHALRVREDPTGMVGDFGPEFEAGYRLRQIMHEVEVEITHRWWTDREYGVQQSREDVAEYFYSLYSCMDVEYIACEYQFPGQCGGPPDHQVFDDEY